MNYFVEEFEAFSKKVHRLDSGVVDLRDAYLFGLCVTTFQCGHALLVHMAFKSDFFQVLAQIIKIRRYKGTGVPDVQICGAIGMVVYNSLETAMHCFDNRWSAEKTFKKFEASGILEQIIWCSTVPVRLVESDTESIAVWELGSVLKHLETTVGFLTPKFKSGTPCGDTLKAILDDRDGSANMQPEILNRLWNISKLVECMDSSESKKKAFGMCQSCKRQPELHGVPLFCCSRCHITHYCSRECQMADWKHHKHRCKKTSNKEERERTLSFHVASLKFIEANCKSVIEELGTMLESAGLADGGLAVVVDFMPNEESVISAFQDPPVFQVVERTLLSDITFTLPLLQPGVKPPLTVFVLRYGGITFFEGFSIEDFRQGLEVGSSID